MFCRHCGQQIDDDSVFCGNCGNQIDPGESIESDVSEPMDLTEQTYINVASERNREERQIKPESAAKSKKLALSIVIAVLLVCVVAGVFFFEQEIRDILGNLRSSGNEQTNPPSVVPVPTPNPNPPVSKRDLDEARQLLDKAEENKSTAERILAEAISNGIVDLVPIAQQAAALAEKARIAAARYLATTERTLTLAKQTK